MPSSRAIQFSTLLGALLFAFHPGTMARGDVSAATFAEYCRDPLPASRQGQFERQLTTAEQALTAGQLDPAQQAMNDAFSAVYRGGAESDVAIKCLGRATANRWHRTQLDLKRQQAAARGSTDLYVIAADRGAPGLVQTIAGQRTTRFRGSVQWVEEISRRLEAERDYGAFLLDAEQAILSACNSAVPELRKRAAQAMRAALDAEQTAFDRPVANEERQMVEGANDLAAAMTGTELALTKDPEVLLVERRIDESLQQLNEARGRDLDPPDDIRSAAWSKRARQRGDDIAAQAADNSLSYSGRDTLYAHASRYYDFGGWTQERDRMDSTRDGIQPQLEAEQARREAELEKAMAAMEQKAAAAREAAADMMKNEEEKQAFKREADAMEAELGF